METVNTSNLSYIQDPGPNQPVSTVVYEVVMAFLCLLAIFLDVLIIHIIFRYRRVHTVPNIFVANWALADVFVLVLFRTNYRLIEFLEELDLPKFLILFCYDTQLIFRNTIFLFILAAVFDWGLAAYNPRVSGRFRKHYAYLLGVIWLLNTTFLLTALVLALSETFVTVVTVDDLLWACYLTPALVVLFMHVMRLVKKIRKTPSDHSTSVLALTTVLMVSSAPYMLLLVFQLYDYFIVEFTYLSTSVITFAMLYKNDQDFQACLQQAVKCTSYRHVDDLAEYRNFGRQKSKSGRLPNAEDS